MEDGQQTEARQVGDELRQLRGSAGMTQTDLSKALSVHSTLIGKIESGARSLQWDQAEALDRLFETGGRLSRLLRESHIKRTVPPWMQNTVLLEQRATEIRYFQPLVVPGPIQTEAYARVLADDGFARSNEDERNRVVQMRLQRLPTMLRQPHLRHISYVIREQVLTDPLGDSVIMKGQLEHILETVNQGVQVQVVPRTSQTGLARYLPFQVLSFGDGRLVAIAEHHEGGTIVDDPMRAGRMLTQFGQLQGIALSPEESVSRIARILETQHVEDQ